MDTRETSPPWAAKTSSQFHMVDVTAKSPTVRKAEAMGSIRMSPSAFEMVRNRRLPKGDALMLAEVAGIMSAKQTAALLPLCHPIPIEEVTIRCELDEARHSITVFCQVSTTAKTGVEMEALMGTNGALLCLYDLIKMVEPALAIEGIRLNFKLGGKHGNWVHPEAKPFTEQSTQKRDSLPLKGLKCAVVTVSDRTAQGDTEDKSGPTAIAGLEVLGATHAARGVVPDDKDQIQIAVRELVERATHLVILTGGTGLGPRDVTIEALSQLPMKEITGVGELLRKSGAIHKRSAWLSNSSAFVWNQTLIVALPGSPKAVTEGLGELGDLIPHALHIIAGGNHG